jgi:uncharacterized protein YaaR (DUF327 family)
MDVYRLKRTDSALGYGAPLTTTGAGGKTGGNFRDSLGGQLKDDYRRRIKIILDELEALSSELFIRVDIRSFQRYLGQIRELLSEIARNAYALSTEHIMDLRGRQRILSAVDVVDQKLNELASDILRSNGDRLDYLARVDEIRGLILDFML